MGSVLARFWARLLECPLKDKPICFHLQKNFTSTGDDKPEEELQRDPYDALQDAFIAKLREVRKENKTWRTENFPFWDELAIENLHNVYTLFANEENGMLDFQHFCGFLESIGDTSSINYRKEKFNEADVNKDGFINVDEFLMLVYFYHPFSEIEGLQGVPKSCMEAAERIRTLNLMSVGEQLKLGLF